jgi:hypothetical protein
MQMMNKFSLLFGALSLSMLAVMPMMAAVCLASD